MIIMNNKKLISLLLLAVTACCSGMDLTYYQTHGSSSCSVSVAKQEQQQDVWRAQTCATNHSAETAKWLEQQDQTQFLAKQFSQVSSDLANKYLQTDLLLKKLELGHEHFSAMQLTDVHSKLAECIKQLDTFFSPTTSCCSGTACNHEC